MYKIKILSSSGAQTFEAVFKTEQEIENWYEATKSNFVDDHQKIIEDITEEIKESERESESIEAIDLGMRLIIQIRALNRNKIKTGAWNQEKFRSLLTSALGLEVERALWNGSLTTAKYLLPSMSDFYSDTEINKIISQIDDHEQKWAYLT